MRYLDGKQWPNKAQNKSNKPKINHLRHINGYYELGEETRQ